MKKFRVEQGDFTSELGNTVREIRTSVNLWEHTFV